MYLDVRRERDKLQAKKVGPMLVVDAMTPWVYRLRNIATGDEVHAHAQRMERYADAQLGITEALKEHVTYHISNYEIERLLDVRKDRVTGQWQFQVRWSGFGDTEATWEDASVLVEDAPAIVAEFLDADTVPGECRRYVDALLKA